MAVQSHTHLQTAADQNFLPFALPWIGEEEINAVVECLRSGWITTGPRVKAFEATFAETVGSRYAVAMNSCTAALHLALEALEILPGEEVLVPTMTFAATAEVVRYLNARPRLIDCEARTLNMSTDALLEYLVIRCKRSPDGVRNKETGARVRAIIPVHYAGLPCEMGRIMEISREFDLAVVEDAAHALPARTCGRAAGTLGIVGAFSFYANKNITTGEGGMLVTDDTAIADRARMMSLHGISRDAWLRYTAQGTWQYDIIAPGFKYNMTDIAAALGIEQLKRQDDLWRMRRDLARTYTEAFADTPELILPHDAPSGDQHAWHLYSVRLWLERLNIGRDAFIQSLRERGIGTSVHFIPLHLHRYYRETYGYTPGDLPCATEAFAGLLSLPLYPRLGAADQERVIAAVLDIVRNSRL